MSQAIRSKAIRWTSTEKAVIVAKCAERIISGKAPYYGETISWARMIFEEQRALDQDRQRQMSSIQNTAKVDFQHEIEAEVNRISEERIEEQRQRKLQRSEKTSEVPVVEQPKNDVDLKINSAIDTFVANLVESIAKPFAEKLKAQLISTMENVVKDLGKEVAVKSPTTITSEVPAAGQDVVELQVVDKKGVEVKALNNQSNEIRAHRIKVAIIGGNDKGSDKAVIRNGLEEVFDLRFVDDSRDFVDQIRNCAIAVVRNKFCPQSMKRTATNVLGKDNILICMEGGPSKVNDMLLEYYAGLQS